MELAALCVFQLLAFNSFAQSNRIDSLKQVLSSHSSDTDSIKIQTLNELSWAYREEGKQQESIKLSEQGLVLARKNSFTRGILVSLSNLGINYQDRGDYASALIYFLEAQKIYESYSDKQGFGRNQSNIGNTYADKGNYPVALEHYFRALKIFEEIKNKEGIASSFNHLGIVYSYLENYEKTLEYFKKALAMNEELGRKKGIVNCIGNIGNVYYFTKQYSKAVENYLKAIKLNEQLGYKSGLSDNYGNIAVVYADQSDSDFVRQGLNPADRFELSLDYSLKALTINREIQNGYGIASNEINIGWCYFKQKQSEKGINYLQKAMKLAKENSFLELEKEAAQKMSMLFEEAGDYKNSLQYYKQYISINDSLKNEENTKKETRLEMQYDFDKKEASVKLDQEKKQAVADAESKRQRIVLILVCCVLIMVFIFAVFAYRSYLQKQKANVEIIHQKEIIEEKQKEIIDSIHYAKRIQTALLTSEKYITRVLRRQG